ncbi:MAG: hypothetical protein GX823_02635 [Clostridiales bacterium]|nr:hypothetical protein [Clostridiales bacterium]
MKGAKTSLFLIELMIALLLFAFCAAICIQLFHASNKRTVSADDLTKAVFQATSAAEIYKSTGGDLKAMAGNYNATQLQYRDGALTVYYDKDWNLALNPIFSSTFLNSGYRIDILENGDDRADISVSKLVQTYENSVITSMYEDIFSITVKAVSR